MIIICPADYDSDIHSFAMSDISLREVIFIPAE